MAIAVIVNIDAVEGIFAAAVAAAAGGQEQQGIVQHVVSAGAILDSRAD